MCYRLDWAGDVLVAPLDEERAWADEAGYVWHLAQRANACNITCSDPAQDFLEVVVVGRRQKVY